MGDQFYRILPGETCDTTTGRCNQFWVGNQKKLFILFGEPLLNGAPIGYCGQLPEYGQPWHVHISKVMDDLENGRLTTLSPGEEIIIVTYAPGYQPISPLNGSINNSCYDAYKNYFEERIKNGKIPKNNPIYITIVDNPKMFWDFLYQEAQGSQNRVWFTGPIITFYYTMAMINNRQRYSQSQNPLQFPETTIQQEEQSKPKTPYKPVRIQNRETFDKWMRMWADIGSKAFKNEEEIRTKIWQRDKIAFASNLDKFKQGIRDSLGKEYEEAADLKALSESMAGVASQVLSWTENRATMNHVITIDEINQYAMEVASISGWYYQIVGSIFYGAFSLAAKPKPAATDLAAVKTRTLRNSKTVSRVKVMAKSKGNPVKPRMGKVTASPEAIIEHPVSTPIVEKVPSKPQPSNPKAAKVAVDELQAIKKTLGTGNTDPEIPKYQWRSRRHGEEIKPGVQAGHRKSSWLIKETGELDRLAIQDADMNQLENWTIETGGKAAVLERPTIEIEGVIVDRASALRWANTEILPDLTPEMVKNAKPVDGWERPANMNPEYAKIKFMKNMLKIISDNPKHPLHFLIEEVLPRSTTPIPHP